MSHNITTRIFQTDLNQIHQNALIPQIDPICAINYSMKHSCGLFIEISENPDVIILQGLSIQNYWK